MIITLVSFTKKPNFAKDVYISLHAREGETSDEPFWRRRQNGLQRYLATISSMEKVGIKSTTVHSIQKKKASSINGEDFFLRTGPRRDDGTL